jgi:hypothetical protein
MASTWRSRGSGVVRARPRAWAGLAAVLAVLAVTSCSAAVDSKPPTSSTSSTSTADGSTTTAPACGADGPVEAKGEDLTTLQLPNAIFLSWAKVTDADCFRLTSSGQDPVSLPADSASYVWSDGIDGAFDLTQSTVSPVLLTVTAFRDGRALRYFSKVIPCPGVVYLAARGSGQNGIFTGPFAQGLGDRGRRVMEGLRTALGKDRHALPAIAVDYPAVAVAFNPSGQIQPGSYPAIYNDSVRLGVEHAQSVVNRLADICPASRLVLFGYSQGAQVIGDAFAGLEEKVRAHVARLILFADAAYAPGDGQLRYRPSAAPGHGIKGQRAAFPPSTHTVIESWCWDEDVVCQSPPRRQFHGDIYDDYEKQAIDAAAKDLGRT